METLKLHQSPMAQFNYDAAYEHHENQRETIEPLNVDLLPRACSPEHLLERKTFQDWYDRQLTYAKDDQLRTHLLRQCYYKVLTYKIEYSSMNQECTDYQLILLLQHLLASYRSHLNI